MKCHAIVVPFNDVALFIASFLRSVQIVDVLCLSVQSLVHSLHHSCHSLHLLTTVTCTRFFDPMVVKKNYCTTVIRNCKNDPQTWTTNDMGLYCNGNV